MASRKSPRAAFAVGAAVIGAALVLSGCVVSGPGLGVEEAVDRDLVTGSIAPPPALTGSVLPDAATDDLSDGRMVRNAVSAADLAGPAGTIPWENTDTGAAGVLSAIVETRRDGETCRAFRTTRRRFDGIALYSGEACTRGAGEWALTRLDEAGAPPAPGL